MRGVSAFLDKTNVNGTQAYSIRGTGHHLVKRDQETGEFEPVDSLTRSVPSEELEANYGAWQDKKITKGALWWKKTVREADGKVQPDEVKNFAQFRKSQMSHDWSRAVGGDKLYTFDSADIAVKESDSGTIARMNTEWTMHRGDWSRHWDWMSPLAPPNANA